ncbi:MAG TPA: N-acetyltransferase [Gemmatales bacterium]|nr:N-acetyltransferase [Gemmatales bacterium]
MSSMITYLTRHRMSIGLHRLPAVPALPEGYVWVPWDNRLIDMYAEVHFLSFRHSLDSTLFRSFNKRAGCWHLINQVRNRSDFLPQANWLIAGPGGCCAYIQCVASSATEGNIQNVAVLPTYRRLGLGRALVLQALHSFKEHGLTSAVLEVTGENGPAFTLYQRMGFRKIDTAYQEIQNDDISY